MAVMRWERMYSVTTGYESSSLIVYETVKDWLPPEKFS